MEKMIESARGLYEFFSANKGHEDLIADGVYVTTDVRCEAMCSTQQRRITLDNYCGGDADVIQFEDMDGGVWRAFIPN